MIKQYIVMSPCYEILRYGHDKIQNQVNDAHTMGKLAKFVIGICDLIDPTKPAVKGNFKFEDCQFDTPDIVLFVNKSQTIILKGHYD